MITAAINGDIEYINICICAVGTIKHLKGGLWIVLALFLYVEFIHL